VQAVRQDQVQPWFQTISRKDKPAEPQARTWRRKS
jgi:hypothetical protein